jgi:hypothetical protein
MVINTYPANDRGSSLAAAHEASESTQAGMPAHVEYRLDGDVFDVVTDEPVGEAR